MYKPKNMELLRKYNFGANNIEYSDLVSALISAANNQGFPLNHRTESVYAGLFHEDWECPAFFHPEHETNDFNIVLMIETVKGTTSASFYAAGKSTQVKADYFAKNVKVFDGRGSRGVLRGISMGGSLGAGVAIGSAAAGLVTGGVKLAAKGINALFRDKEAYQAELDWYSSMMQLLDDVFAG